MRLIVVAGEPITGHRLALAPSTSNIYGARCSREPFLSSLFAIALRTEISILRSFRRRGEEFKVGEGAPSLHLCYRTIGSRFDPINPRIIIIGDENGGRTPRFVARLLYCRGYWWIDGWWWSTTRLIVPRLTSIMDNRRPFYFAMTNRRRNCVTEMLPSSSRLTWLSLDGSEKFDSNIRRHLVEMLLNSTLIDVHFQTLEEIRAWLINLNCII